MAPSEFLMDSSTWVRSIICFLEKLDWVFLFVSFGKFYTKWIEGHDFELWKSTSKHFIKLIWVYRTLKDHPNLNGEANWTDGCRQFLPLPLSCVDDSDASVPENEVHKSLTFQGVLAYAVLWLLLMIVCAVHLAFRTT
jgi:hypothetical protein